LEPGVWVIATGSRSTLERARMEMNREIAIHQIDIFMLTIFQ
jgi:hypothetical protein